jgi:hypothetical protein
MFYDKNGIVFSDKEKKKHRDEGSAALVCYNNLNPKKNLGKKYPRISEAQKGNKHPSKQQKCKVETQLGILWKDKAETTCLLIIVSVDVKRRIFGFFQKSPRSWGKYRGGATVKNCYWGKYLDHYKIIEFKTRKEANEERKRLEKELKPRYKGQFNYDHVLTYRAQCQYERSLMKSTRDALTSVLSTTQEVQNV